jgi:hypothetical protein
MAKVREDETYIYRTTASGKEHRIAKSGLSDRFLAELRSAEDIPEVSAKDGGKRAPLSIAHEQPFDDGLGKRYFLNDGTRTTDPELAQAIREGKVGTAKMPERVSTVDKVRDFSQHVLEPTVRDTMTDAMVPIRPLWNASGAVLDAAKKLPDVAERTGIYASDFAHTMTGGRMGTSREDAIKRTVGTPSQLTPEAVAQMKAMDPNWQPGQVPADMPVGEAERGLVAGANSSPLSQVQQLAMGQAQPHDGSASIRTTAPVSAGGGYGAAAWGELKKGAKMEADAIKAGEALGLKRAAEEQAVFQERQKFAEVQAQKQAALAERAQTIGKEQLTKLEAIQQNLRNISTDIDPNRFWKSKDSGAKFTAAIGIMLGGIGGGPNRALEIVDGAIERDIQAQQASFQNALARGRADAESQSNIFAAHRQLLGDEQAALAATKLSMLEAFEARLQGVASKYATEEIQARTQAALAATQQAKAKQMADLGPKLEQLALARAEMGLKMAELANKGPNGELLIPEVGVGLDKEATKEVRAMASARNNSMRLVGDAAKIRAKFGGEAFPTVAKKDLQRIGAELTVALNKSGRLGSLDEGAKALLQQMAGGDLTSWSPSMDGALQHLAQSIDAGFWEQAKPYLARRIDASSQLGITAR